jgi:hypothetical protein
MSWMYLGDRRSDLVRSFVMGGVYGEIAGVAIFVMKKMEL